MLDLTNDSGAIAYDGDTMLGNSVSSTAVVYLNGAAVSGCAFAWAASNCAISGANTATVTVSAIDDGESEGTATCKVTGIPNYPNTELVKVFTVAKQYKGDHGQPGEPGVSITKNKQWYILHSAGAAEPPKPIDDDTEPAEPATPATMEKWMSTPPEAVNGYVVWTCYGSIFSDDTPENRHIKYSAPVKDNAYALAQGKTTNYYSPTEPVNKIKKGDCWFDTGYVRIDTPAAKSGYLGKFVVCQASTAGGVRVEAAGADRYVSSASGSTYLVKITPDNIDNGLFTAGTTAAYETGNLKQWDGDKWEDIAGELVTNKLTANYINALDITAKKITILDKDDPTKKLFEADGLDGNGSVSIANFTVKNDRLYSGKHDTIGSKEAGIYLGADGLSIGGNFKVTAGSVEISDYTKSITKKYSITDFDVVPNPAPAWWDS